jgi:hypothetical protein
MKPQNLASILLQSHRHLRIHVIKRSSPLAVLYIKSAGKMGTDEPPVLMLSMVGQSSFHLDIHLSS